MDPRGGLVDHFIHIESAFLAPHFRERCPDRGITNWQRRLAIFVL